MLKEKESSQTDGLGSEVSTELAFKSSAKQKRNAKHSRPVSSTGRSHLKKYRSPDPDGGARTSKKRRNLDRNESNARTRKREWPPNDDIAQAPFLLSEAPAFVPGDALASNSRKDTGRIDEMLSLMVPADQADTTVETDVHKYGIHVSLTHIPVRTHYAPRLLTGDFWSSLHSEDQPAGGSTILVSKALAALSCISTDDVALFVPGAQFLGKTFIYSPNTRRKTV